MMPPHLAKQDPSPAELKRIVAEHARQTGKTREGDEVSVEIAKGGYLVTRKYADPTSRCCIWEFTFFVGDNEISGKQPDPPATEATRPPALPPSGHERDARPDSDKLKFNEPLKLDPIIVKPGDIAELNNPADLEKKLREVSFEGTLIQDEFSAETRAVMEEIMAAAGQATLETGLTVGSVLPVAGTVIATGRAFSEQYNKTRDVLLKNGVSPADAHQQALLQATVVAGMAAGTDLATGSVLGKLKAIIRNPLLQSAVRDKNWSKEAAKRLGQGVDTGVDVAAAYLLSAGGDAPLKGDPNTGQPPAPPPAYGADRNGLQFLVR